MASCGHSCSQPPPQGHTSMASYGHPSLPFASPQTLQTLQTLQALQALNTLQTLKNRKTLKTLTWHASSCSQQPPRATHQWLLVATLAANRHPRATHQWLLMGVQVCRLPALKRSRPSKPLKLSKPSKHSKRFKPSKPLKTVKPLKR